MIELSLSLLIAGGIGAFLVGFAAGGWLLRSRDEDRRMALRFERELAEARSELERYRDRVSQHFEQSSELFRQLTEQYRSLYQHLATGARDLARKDLAAFEPASEPPRLESPEASLVRDGGATVPPTVPPPAASPEGEERESA